MRRWITVVLLAIALVAAGCSDDKKDTAKSDKSSSKSDDQGSKSDDKSSSKSDDKSDKTDDDNDKSDHKASGGGGPFCDIYKGYDKEFADLDPMAAPKIDDLTEQLGAMRDAVDTMVDAAPDAIAGDLELVMGAAIKLFEALEAAGGDFTKLDPATFTAMDSAELQAAQARINTYLSQECGIDMPTG